MYHYYKKHTFCLRHPATLATLCYPFHNLKCINHYLNLKDRGVCIFNNMMHLCITRNALKNLYYTKCTDIKHCPAMCMGIKKKKSNWKHTLYLNQHLNNKECRIIDKNQYLYTFCNELQKNYIVCIFQCHYYPTLPTFSMNLKLSNWLHNSHHCQPLNPNKQNLHMQYKQQQLYITHSHSFHYTNYSYTSHTIYSQH